MFLYHWTVEFSEMCCRRGQNSQAGVVYLRMWLLLVFCFLVIIFSVLCLLDVLHFRPCLREEICLQTEQQHWPYCKRCLIAACAMRCCCCPPLDFRGKLMWLMWPCGDYWQWRGGEDSPFSGSMCHYVRRTPVGKCHCTADSPWAPWALLCGVE